MTKQNAIETVTSYFEEIDTRALVLDLKTTKDAEADYEASKYLFGDQDPESEPLENHEDLLEENEKLLRSSLKNFLQSGMREISY